jgi:soluble lytic murein transglycosylase
MQITPGAVTDWARSNKCPPPSRQELFAPELNLEIGAWYLALCGQHWNGFASRDILQLAEYNAGRSKVTKDWAPENPETIIELERITYPGTRSYIKQILERQHFYRESATATEAPLAD